MSRMHGKNCRAYLGSRDVSGDLLTLFPRFGADAQDVTTFAAAGWREAQAGLLDWEVAFEGFHDPAVGGYGRQLENLLGANSGGELSIYEGNADTVGDVGLLFPPGVIDSREQPMAVAEMIRLNGHIKGYGQLGQYGRLLHPLGTETNTGVGTSLQAAAQTLIGGRGNLHVTAVTGTWTIKIQHSADGAAWSDLLTFTQVTAATAQSVAVTGTIYIYTRVTFTENVAGSITFVAGFSRY